ncbi:hypothetical protein [Planotetraspora sp. GP83]
MAAEIDWDMLAARMLRAMRPDVQAAFLDSPELEGARPGAQGQAV